jgi:hypothetical protein
MAMPVAATAQHEAGTYPLPGDVQTIDGIVAAFFEVVSTPAGERPNQERDASLHLPGARIRIIRPGTDGVPALHDMDLEGFYQRYGGVRDQPFYEREIHRVVHRFGSIAHVWSTYAGGPSPDGPPSVRGISSIELYHDGQRWWITGWSDVDERPGCPLPAEYLPSSSP